MAKFMKMMNNISRSQAVFRCSKISAPDLHSCHYAYALTICKNPGQSQENLASELCVNKSTVARRIDWCLENGYVTRNPAPEDKRCLCVYPTEKAISLLPSIKAVAREWTELITEGIDEGELEIFHSVLLKIEERAKEASEI